MYYIALLFIAISLYYQAVADNETIINVTEHLESELNNEVNNTSVDVQWYSYIPEENENIIKVIEDENIIWEKSNDEKCVEIKYNRSNNNITLVTLRIKTNDTLNFKYYHKENGKWSLEDDDEYETAEEDEYICNDCPRSYGRINTETGVIQYNHRPEYNRQRVYNYEGVNCLLPDGAILESENLISTIDEESSSNSEVELDSEDLPINNQMDRNPSRDNPIISGHNTGSVHQYLLLDIKKLSSNYFDIEYVDAESQASIDVYYRPRNDNYKIIKVVDGDKVIWETEGDDIYCKGVFHGFDEEYEVVILTLGSESDINVKCFIKENEEWGEIYSCDVGHSQISENERNILYYILSTTSDSDSTSDEYDPDLTDTVEVVTDAVIENYANFLRGL